jgi:RHS repeat-associated protein
MSARHRATDVFDHLLATEVDTTGDGTYNVIDHYVLDVTPESPSAGVPGTATAQPVLVFNGTEQLIGRNLVAPNAAGADAVDIEGAVTSLTQADTDQYNLSDKLGSLRIIVDNVSATLDQINYNSAGQIAYESDSSIAHFAGFAGGHVDPYTALLDEFYHRWYNAAIGKWLSEDPADFAAGDSDLSRYAHNDAAGVTDLAGLTGEPPGPGNGETTSTPAVGVDIPDPADWYQNEAGNWIWESGGTKLAITLNGQNNRAMGYIFAGNRLVGEFVAAFKEGTQDLYPVVLPEQELSKQNMESSPLKFELIKEAEKEAYAAKMSAELATAWNKALNLGAAIEKGITEQQAITMKGEMTLWLELQVKYGALPNKAQQMAAASQMVSYQADLALWLKQNVINQ